MSIRACILGATGYGGGELLRLLAQHPELDALDGLSRSRGGTAFGSVHPHLNGVVAGAFSEAPDWRALAAAERPVLFAALPHGEFAKQWPALWDEIGAAGLHERLAVIDLSGDFRLQSAKAFARHYGHAHPCPEWLGKFRYGLPELNESRPEGRSYTGASPTLIANPGCFATAIQLALLPLARLPDPGFIAVSGVTGSSGSGATPSDTTHHPTRAHDFRAYKVAGHQHFGEVEQMFALAGAGTRTVSFVPHSAPLVRGIFVTAQFALPKGIDAAALRDAYKSCYAEAPFVRIVDGSPRVAAVVGSNFCDLSVTVRDGHAIVLAALDNLVKGMAGQAVQNMNLALGLDEATGLRQAALYPG
ncbi:MAG: N-acetyl-gamma-glutamyl-phosphate reductase [Xanthomonadaceae bacterium]|nr:N-acetyl-gamma-glutamyl-phosphate reductase [Xanthomonadaceae bacterium]